MFFGQLQLLIEATGGQYFTSVLGLMIGLR